MARSTSPRSLAKKKPQTSLILLEEVGGKGRGVFAGRDIAAQEEVLEFLGNIVDVSELEDLTHALQIGPREFLTSSGDVDDYVNHSCEPNCGIRNDDHRVVLFALRDIAKDDEITFDYSTTQTGGFWSMLCQCGSAKCRGMIGDFQDLPVNTKAFYVRQGAVLTYLVEEPGVKPSKVSNDEYKSGRRSRKKPIPARNC
jgi:hypothetical protein